MTMPLRVLVVEDSATDAKLVVQELRRTGCPIVFERVDEPEAMRSALEQASWDLVVSDWSMPRFSAPRALALLQELEQDIPFIIVSGTIGEEAAVAAMRAGAHDYVLKDKLTRLAPAVERELREHHERRARRDAEQALRESEARYRRMIETTNQGVWILDAERRTTFVNARMASMLGCEVGDVVGRRPDEFLDDEARATFAAEMLQREQGMSRQSELRLTREDGESFWTVIEATPMLDADGRYEGAFALVMDNSERKRAEEAQRRAEEERGRLEDQLRQSQKMEAIGRLAGGVAHDFNNVLSVILSYSEILMMDLKREEPMRSDVEEIHKAAQRAAQLTRQLLLFSRQQVMEAKVLDLNELLGGIDRMLQRILGADVDLVSRPAETLGRIRADPGGMEQVIMNLVVNARDAMPTGGQLTIETCDVDLDEHYASEHVGATAGPHVMLSVSDTGIGMDGATQSRIFEPFFTTKEKGKGTGLGLSTVFGIVRQAGGTVWVYSEPRKGTTFKVYLPRVDAPVAVATSSASPATLRGNETILLVDDDDQVRIVARAILQRNGYHIIDARNAGEAMLRCEEFDGTIHLLVTDVVMPQASGPELARRLATLRPDMKVLCMSGYTDDSIVRHGVIEANVAYLQKPVTPVALATKVRAVLDGGSRE